MKRSLLLILLLLTTGLRADDDDGWPGDLREDQQKVEELNRVATAPGITPEASVEIERQRTEAVDRISAIADTRPDNPAAQLAVGKSLASVAEAPRAIPYAERGLKLAEASGDPKLVREALLTGADVFYRAGNYKLARERAQRVLKDNPRDKDALALYMQVKDRGVTASAAPARGTTSGSGGGSSGFETQSGAQTTTAGPGVTMTSASSIESQKQIALGWSRLKLDATEALKHFDQAVAADPESPQARLERAKARLTAGDAAGARADTDFVLTRAPQTAEAFAVRAEARRVLGEKEEELLADLQAAANLDGRFAEAYKSATLRAGKTDTSSGGASAPDGPRGMIPTTPMGRSLLALIIAATAVLLAAVLISRRRAPAPTPTPRP